MKTPKDFDYDIWKDNSGHYYVRVKRTGETARVSEDVVRELWRELYRMEKYRKETTITDADGSYHSRLYSLDRGWDEDEEQQSEPNEPWLETHKNPYEAVETGMLEADFIRQLTEKQKIMYRLHFQQGFTAAECAARNHTTVRNAEKLISAIRKKAKTFF